MANKLYIGNSVLIDMSSYYTKSEVDTAISNVDVSDQLSNYVEKDGSKVLSDNNFTDALKTKLEGLSNFDPTSINSAISAIQSTLGDITGDGAAVTSALDTWAEIKAFVADYTNAGDLQDLINTTTSNIQTWVGQQGYLTSSEAASTYLTQTDAASTYVDQANMSAYLLSADAADTYLASATAASTYQPIVTGLDATVVTKANGAVQNGGGVASIVKISASDYAAIVTKDANTLYIVEDNAPAQAGS